MLKLSCPKTIYKRHAPAAFRRLCVETPRHPKPPTPVPVQPPSGGCVLKLIQRYQAEIIVSQPPSGGCVLKQPEAVIGSTNTPQPPSGGCVLKHLRGQADIAAN